MCKNKEYKINVNANVLARFYAIKYFSSLFKFCLSSVMGCLGNGTLIHTAAVIIEEDREKDVGRLNRTSDHYKVNSACNNIQYLIIARNERPKIINAFLVT